MSYYEKRIADLEARVAELSRQQRLKAIPVEAKLLERYALMQAEVANLKSEADRLKAEVNYWRIEAETDHARWLRVLEENDRLRKAGDAMAFIMSYEKDEEFDGFVEAWNAARDGKPSE